MTPISRSTLRNSRENSQDEELEEEISSPAILDFRAFTARAAEPSFPRLATSPQPRTTCLINNYNYGNYIEEAVESALAQTTPFDEILVVDDGSTDDSLSRLQTRYGEHATVRILPKQNEGQLSCFNEGFQQATGDIVFFLDADDLFEPNHVQEMLAVYEKHPHSDFVFCGYRLFGEADDVWLWSEQDQDLGFSVVHNMFYWNWVGAPTSCLSLRRRILEKILPLPMLKDWRVRADDCLVYGAAIAGASKYNLAQPLTRYRVHDANRFFGRTPPNREAEDFRHKLAINRLYEFIIKRVGYKADELAELCHEEFLTIEKPTYKQFRHYVQIGLKSRKSFSRKKNMLTDMWRHYRGSKRRAA